jgi:hypothetical protein
MKTRTVAGYLVAFTMMFLTTGFNASQYQLVEKEMLKAQPEKYKNKKIYFVSKYFGYTTTFPKYMERSGIKAGKYFHVRTNPQNFPVVAQKKKFSDLIIAMKKGSMMKIYGKVRKFAVSPKHSRAPHYFLEVADIIVTKEPVKGENNDNSDKLPRWKRRAMRKIRNM